MASTNKTPLGLNHWSLDDKPRMEDFNADNQTINDLIAGLQNKVTALEKQTQVEVINFKPVLRENDRVIDADYEIQKGQFWRQGNHAHVDIYIKLKKVNEQLGTGRLYIYGLPQVPEMLYCDFASCSTGFVAGTSGLHLLAHAANKRNNLYCGNGTSGGAFPSNKITDNFHIVLSVDYTV